MAAPLYSVKSDSIDQQGLSPASAPPAASAPLEEPPQYDEAIYPRLQAKPEEALRKINPTFWEKQRNVNNVGYACLTTGLGFAASTVWAARNFTATPRMVIGVVLTLFVGTVFFIVKGVGYLGGRYYKDPEYRERVRLNLERAITRAMINGEQPDFRQLSRTTDFKEGILTRKFLNQRYGPSLALEANTYLFFKTHFGLEFLDIADQDNIDNIAKKFHEFFRSDTFRNGFTYARVLKGYTEDFNKFNVDLATYPPIVELLIQQAQDFTYADFINNNGAYLDGDNVSPEVLRLLRPKFNEIISNDKSPDVFKKYATDIQRLKLSPDDLKSKLFDQDIVKVISGELPYNTFKEKYKDNLKLLWEDLRKLNPEQANQLAAVCCKDIDSCRHGILAIQNTYAAELEGENPLVTYDVYAKRLPNEFKHLKNDKHGYSRFRERNGLPAIQKLLEQDTRNKNNENREILKKVFLEESIEFMIANSADLMVTREEIIKSLKEDENHFDYCISFDRGFLMLFDTESAHYSYVTDAEREELRTTVKGKFRGRIKELTTLGYSVFSCLTKYPIGVKYGFWTKEQIIAEVNQQILKYGILVKFFESFSQQPANLQAEYKQYIDANEIKPLVLAYLIENPAAVYKPRFDLDTFALEFFNKYTDRNFQKDYLALEARKADEERYWPEYKARQIMHHETNVARIRQQLNEFENPRLKTHLDELTDRLTPKREEFQRLNAEINKYTDPNAIRSAQERMGILDREKDRIAAEMQALEEKERVLQVELDRVIRTPVSVTGLRQAVPAVLTNHAPQQQLETSLSEIKRQKSALRDALKRITSEKIELEKINSPEFPAELNRMRQNLSTLTDDCRRLQSEVDTARLAYSIYEREYKERSQIADSEISRLERQFHLELDACNKQIEKAKVEIQTRFRKSIEELERDIRTWIHRLERSIA